MGGAQSNRNGFRSKQRWLEERCRAVHRPFGAARRSAELYNDLMNTSADHRPLELPIVDIGCFLTDGSASDRIGAARAIEAACRDTGFFYLTGHAIPGESFQRLEKASRRFFALPAKDKLAIEMARGGPAWRGYFPVGGELTSGKPDLKEGVYFGTELPADHPRVSAGWPLHGANLWPEQIPELRSAVLGYMDVAVRAGHALLEAVGMSLGLEPQYFARTYTAEPTILFRIFHYPAVTPDEQSRTGSWGVGEHTDYGLLTLLAQDENGGLQVRSTRGWIEAPPVAGALVCNIGDMLDRLTGGWYRSTPHRVRNTSGRDRLSFPLFFDPDFAAEIKPLPRQSRLDAARSAAETAERWDGVSVHRFSGTYGDYLLSKVAKVFPQLSRKVL
jgi:isopenicillin N synthase-like dioxygenase